MKLKILICDDDSQNLRELTTHVRSYMENKGVPYELTAEGDPRTILMNSKSYDLALLDIQMQISGISLAGELKRRNERVALFFVTNYEEYQDDAMDLRAFRFFEKPFRPKRLYAGLDKAMEYIDGAGIDLFLSGEGGQKRVLVDDILYLTRDARHAVVVCRQGTVRPKDGFDELEDELPGGFFYLVHKSFLVNLHYIDRYSYTELYLTDGTRIPIAPRKQAAFHKFWFDYLRRR